MNLILMFAREYFINYIMIWGSAWSEENGKNVYPCMLKT